MPGRACAVPRGARRRAGDALRGSFSRPRGCPGETVGGPAAELGTRCHRGPSIGPVVQEEALDPLEPPTSLALPAHCRTNHPGEKWREKFCEDGETVRA